MSSPAAVLVCVLAMLGRNEKNTVPVEFVHVRLPHIAENVEAFASRTEGRIYLLTYTPIFRAAQRGELEALKKVASIYVHEEWHVRHGGDERAAYEAQLITLTMLGSGPGSGLYGAVKKSMLQVMKNAPGTRASTALLIAQTSGQDITAQSASGHEVAACIGSECQPPR
jgi:hypothetical protein